MKKMKITIAALAVIALIGTAEPVLAQQQETDRSSTTTTSVEDKDDDNDHDCMGKYGLIGLVGLVGLLGLRKKNHVHTNVDYRKPNM